MCETTIKSYLNYLHQALDKLPIDQISQLVDILKDKLISGKTVFFAGNGGSAATASHAVCDLNKTVLGKNPVISSATRFQAISLSDNIPLLTAIANDLSYDHVFSEPLKNLATSGDLLLVISGSGNSPNIIRALETAKELKLQTVGFLGFDGGQAKNLVDLPFIVPSHDYGIVEDIHMMLIHLITRHFKDYNQNYGS